ncbi:MAG: hypothetical protein ABIH03_01915, partial [Pseudomonadota bacterium]
PKVRLRVLGMGVETASRAPKQQNSHLLYKVRLREWLVAQWREHAQVDRRPRVVECFGPWQEMWARVWSRCAEYLGADGDNAERWLGDHALGELDLFDLDPYGSPWPCIAVIGRRATAPTIGIVATDGALRAEAKYRGKCPGVLAREFGWDFHDHALAASVYLHYPRFARAAIERLTRRPMLAYAVSPYGRRAVMYWATLLGAPDSSRCDHPATAEIVECELSASSC